MQRTLPAHQRKLGINRSPKSPPAPTPRLWAEVINYRLAAYDKAVVEIIVAFAHAQ